MPSESARTRSTRGTRDRILAVALEVLGDDPDAGMGRIASAAGVVRRTLYAHFPSRLDLVKTLTEGAVAEMVAVLDDLHASDAPADARWAEFVARVWPVTHRYRVLLSLRRGEYGETIHNLLGPVDDLLAGLVSHGQHDNVFTRHLGADVLSQIAYGVVFAVADSDRSSGPRGARAAIVTSLMMMGVGEERAIARADGAAPVHEEAHPSRRPTGA